MLRRARFKKVPVGLRLYELLTNGAQVASHMRRATGIHGGPPYGCQACGVARRVLSTKIVVYMV